MACITIYFRRKSSGTILVQLFNLLSISCTRIVLRDTGTTMTKKQQLTTLIFTALCLLARAQSLEVHADTVYVVASREWPFTRQAASIDSNLTMPHQWMSIPAISFNAVSINGLATLSNRGMSSRHTAILFEGIPVNGITTGVYDASLLPLAYFNTSKLLKDGLAATFGDHTMGGGLLLSHKASTGNQVEAGLFTSTLRNSTALLSIQRNSSKLNWNLAWEENDHQNVISFQQNGLILKSDSFAKKGRNLNAGLSLPLAANHTLTAAAWLQNFHRKIPGPYFVDLNQNQWDQNLRFSLAHTWHNKDWKVKNQLAYFDETLQFTSSGVNSLAHSNLFQCVATADWKKRWILALTFRNEKVDANFYTSQKQRNTLMLSMGRKWQMFGTRWQALISPHFINGSTTPINAELRWEGALFFGSLLRNYNLPGFNDLYWPSGGNPDLKPEQAHQINLGIDKKWSENWKINATVFSYWVDNYIQWLPQSASVWTPKNIRSVWSRGGDVMVEYLQKNTSHTLWIRMQYGLSRCTNTKDTQTAAIGRQLLYVPIHKAGVTAGFTKKQWHVIASVSYLGKRFDTTDNFQSLRPAITGLLKTEYRFNINRISIQSGVGIDNLWQTDYQLLRSYPMPRRSITFFATFQFNS